MFIGIHNARIAVKRRLDDTMIFDEDAENRSPNKRMNTGMFHVHIIVEFNFFNPFWIFFTIALELYTYDIVFFRRESSRSQ